MRCSIQAIGTGLLVAVGLTVLASEIPPRAPFTHDIRPGPAVTSERMLSSYSPVLANTPGDTKVYVMQGAERGGTAVVVGGTHGNEIAGMIAGVLLVERATVARGRLVVIPHANNSAVSYVDPQRPGPEWIEVDTPSGARRFKYGARRTRPEDQGAADPVKYRHPGSDEALDGNEVRNLDRAYPGDAAGPLTQRVAAGIMRVLTDERADLAFDLHEAGPESRLAWMIVANPKNIDLAAMAVLELEELGLSMKLEPSSETFRGLSHREWGDHTGARAFLFETPNPWQVDQPGAANVVDDPRYPLAKRVGAHLASLQAVIRVFNEDAPAASRIEVRGLPTLQEITRDGVGKFLR